jgi:hypothetical protein
LKYFFIAPLLMYGALWAQRPEPPTIKITPIHEYVVTDYTPGVLVQDGWVQSLTLEQWRAVQVFPEDYQYVMARIAWCESRFDAAAVGDGGRSRGAWQVQPRFWGEVPPDLVGQAQQAANIVREWGTDPWSTKDGCEGWSR